MKTIIKIFGLILVVLLMACEFVEELPELELMPLAVGNKWEYVENDFKNSQVNNTDTSSIEIVGVKKIVAEEEEVKVYSVEISRGKLSFTTYLGVEGNGIVDYGFDAGEKLLYDSNIDELLFNSGVKIEIEADETLSYRGLYAKFPVIRNEHWTYTYKVPKYKLENNVIVVSGEQKEVPAECVEVDVLVETKAGNFRCICYKYGDDENYTLVYYKIEVGVIKSETYEDGELVNDKVLVSYDLF